MSNNKEKFGYVKSRSLLNDIESRMNLATNQKVSLFKKSFEKRNIENKDKKGTDFMETMDVPSRFYTPQPQISKIHAMDLQKLFLGSNFNSKEESGSKKSS